MARNSQSVSVTEEDRNRFPDLFATRKQIVLDTKLNAGKSVRSKLKTLKETLIEEKIRKENEMIRERMEFEKLLEKFSKFKNSTEQLPIHLLRLHEGRKSMIINDRSLLGSYTEKPRSGYTDEKEIRLPSSNQKFIDIDKRGRNNKTYLANEKEFTTTAGDSSTIVLHETSKKSRMSSRGKIPLISKSQSVNNLLKGKNSLIPPKIDMSKISEINEHDEIDIEERMKNLPHWKYGASFNTYIKGLDTINPHIKEEFLKYYKNKDYK